MSELNSAPLSPIDVDGSRTRRLVPQFSLTRQDLGSDNRSSTTKNPSETPKKPGTPALCLLFMFAIIDFVGYRYSHSLH